MVTFHKNGNNPRNLYNAGFGDYSYLCSRYEKDCFIYNYVGYDSSNIRCTECARQGNEDMLVAVSKRMGQNKLLVQRLAQGQSQEWGKPAIPLKAGDIIDIPEGVKHWHGAQADSWFQHLATHAKTSGEERNEWLEPVSDEEYNKLK